MGQTDGRTDRHADRRTDGRQTVTLRLPLDAASVIICYVKPRPHQQQCRSDIAECYKLNDIFDKVERCFVIAAVFGKNIETMFFREILSFLSTKSKQNEHAGVNLLVSGRRRVASSL